MTKDDLLVQLRAAKNSFVLGLAGMYLLKQEQTHTLLERGIGKLAGYTIPFKQVAQSMRDPQKREADFKNFSKFIMRAIFKDSYEVLKEYCYVTGQNSKRIAQPWHQFSRMIRNCLAHDYTFKFSGHDKKKLPVTWDDMTITADMDGAILTFDFMGPGKMLDLCQDIYSFAESSLE